MELVVGASESTMRSLLGKLGGLLAQEYTLIRGVGGDLQYITDELRTMQSFLRDLGDAEQDHRMKDWMKQIRDMTFDAEDCIDDSGNRIHRPRWLHSDMCCYLVVNSVYEVLTWGPRREIASKISDLKMRAQQISERRQRYGVDNPKTKDKNPNTAVFNAAGNQDRSLQLVAIKDPVGLDKQMKELENWVMNPTIKAGVLSIVGYGGVGKTAIATALYQKFGHQFAHRAMVTVSQSTNIEAILKNIKSQVMPQSKDCQSSDENLLTAAFEGMRGRISRGKSAFKAKCLGISEDTQGGDTTREQLNSELRNHFKKKSYLILIDDVWSATTWEDIRKAFPPTEQHSEQGRIIITTRFPAVATARRGQGGDRVHKAVPLAFEKSRDLFDQALSESNQSEDEIRVPDEVLEICGGLPLAIVALAGYAACNAHKGQDWDAICTSLFPEKKRLEELSSAWVKKKELPSGDTHDSAPNEVGEVKKGRDTHYSAPNEAGKVKRKGLTQEELGRIVSHCYNDMPAEIMTCSMYLSIFPKGSRISRKRLIRRWVAEGFVSEKDGMSVEDVAETYFSHLVRRKIVRPVEHSSSGKVKKCVVHDMVLEHIVSKASEENFITVVGGHWLMQAPISKVRRLSLQGSDPNRTKDTEKMNLSHVRSLTMFESLNQLPSNSFKFGIVQVLDLEGCKGFKEHHMKEICGMLLIRYLSLRRTDAKDLPRTIGKLQNLETLDIRETRIVKLPTDVCSLDRLVNILGGDKETHRALKLPEEFVKKKKMKALRILSGIQIVDGLVDLHHLTELRKLAIYKLQLTDDDAILKLSSSIEYLCGYSLHTLVIDDDSSKFFKLLDEMTSPPKFLIALELSGMMVELPTWINQLDTLTNLTLSMTALRKDNLGYLSNLVSLFSLTFTLAAEKVDPKILAVLEENKLYSGGEIIVPDGGFSNLKLLRFSAALMPLLVFSESAMPNLERLELRFNMFDGIYGAENLKSLKEIYLRLVDKDCEAITIKIVEELKSAVKRPKGRNNIVAGEVDEEELMFPRTGILLEGGNDSDTSVKMSLPLSLPLSSKSIAKIKGCSQNPTENSINYMLNISQ
ncbi:hypothetical protein EJB05_46157, partial [Eragrostis curvula]